MCINRQFRVAGLTTFVLTIMAIQLFGQSYKTSGVLERNTDNHIIPFNEGWDSGDFETNQWTNNNNWIIESGTGNPVPSVKFNSTPVLNNYSSSLLSLPIDAEIPLVGNIILKFDFKLDDNLANGTEYMYCKLLTDSDTVTVFAVHNIGSQDWITHTKYFGICCWKKLYLSF